MCFSVKRLAYGYLPYTKFQRNPYSPFWDTKRGTRVRTCSCTPPETFVLEAGITYRIALCQNRRFSSLSLYASGGIRTNHPSVIDKTILPSSVRVERCLSRPNRTGRSGAKCKWVKSRATCLSHVSKWRHHPHHLPQKNLLSPPHGGYRPTKFEPDPTIGSAWSVGR